MSIVYIPIKTDFYQYFSFGWIVKKNCSSLVTFECTCLQGCGWSHYVRHKNFIHLKILMKILHANLRNVYFQLSTHWHTLTSNDSVLTLCLALGDYTSHGRPMRRYVTQALGLGNNWSTDSMVAERSKSFTNEWSTEVGMIGEPTFNKQCPVWVEVAFVNLIGISQDLFCIYVYLYGGGHTFFYII